MTVAVHKNNQQPRSLPFAARNVASVFPPGLVSCTLYVDDPDAIAIDAALAAARRQLLTAATAVHGQWVGELSSSALSTATAVCALALGGGPGHRGLVRSGLDWLASHANADGGYGDTVASKSNLSTTALVWSVLKMNAASGPFDTAAWAAEQWIVRAVGSLEAPALAEAIAARYGKDRTFSAPSLPCVPSRDAGPPQTAWPLVPALPFELPSFRTACGSGSACRWSVTPCRP